MSLKRKLEVDQEDTAPVQHRPMKQLRVSSFTFPASQAQDAAMSDVSMSPASTSSTSVDNTASSYPTFNLYPFPSYGASDIEMDVRMDTSSSSWAESRTSSNASEIVSSVGLLQPTASFVHNFDPANAVTLYQSSNCSQIPRLRVACEAGISGNRSLWTQCDECGAIEMIETTDTT